jgi:hypothetical protein
LFGKIDAIQPLLRWLLAQEHQSGGERWYQRELIQNLVRNAAVAAVAFSALDVLVVFFMVGN